jgi:hypothetical protein
MIEMSTSEFCKTAEQHKIGWELVGLGECRYRGGSDENDVRAESRPETKSVRLTPLTLLGELFLSLVVEQARAA